MRRRGARVIMKDPLALFSAEWLAARFDMPVVVIIRHPAAFVASLIAAGWTKFPFRRPRRPGAADARPARAVPRRDRRGGGRDHPEPLEVGILLWRAMHHHIGLLRRDHPDWIFVRHEDLSQDPVEGFREIYARLGLAFTPGRRGADRARCPESNGGLAALSIFGTRRRTVRNSRDNLSYFRKRLTEPQIARIKDASRDVWPEFYADGDW